MPSDRTQEARGRAERTIAFYQRVPGRNQMSEVRHANDVILLANRVSTLETALRGLLGWNPQLDLSMSHLHPQHRDAILAARAALAGGDNG